jgi:uncharacterized OB-fold protein
VSESLQARHVVDFLYQRSVGGNTGQFLSGLARRELRGSRISDGRVVVPPVEWDPDSGEAVADLVPVAEMGTVRSWTWVPAPLPGQPLDHPFAFALVQLDGADTSLFHVVDAGDESAMATGMRVRADWREERSGSVLDLRAFVPDPSETAPPDLGGASRLETPERPAAVPSDVRLEYTYEAGAVLTGFLRALGRRQLQGGRCPSCSSVYVPPRPRCPACRAGPLAPLLLDPRGAVVSYTIVHLPFHGMTLELPFAWAWIRLDGADVPFAHLLGEAVLEDLHVGLRVEAVWVPDDEVGPTWESIKYFRPVAL